MTPALSHSDYPRLCREFRWDYPARLNMADQIIGDWAAAEPERRAVIEYDGRTARPLSYGELAAMTDRLAHALALTGGERVGVLRTQSGWTAAAHAAVWKSAAISVPLFKLFGEDALRLRLEDAGVETVITDPEGRAMLAAFDLRVIVPEEDDLPDAGPFATADTGPETPAVMIYTSGTTGAPKGALHGHRVLTGHLPGVEMSHDLLHPGEDVLWTPADWAWIGGMFDVAMPGLALGVPVVAARLPKFDAAACARLIRDCGVTAAFLPPTALRMLKAADMQIAGLRSVASAGETLGAEMLAWGRDAFGLEINEFYGQTECNMVAACAHSMFPTRPGWFGKAAPGFEMAVIDEAGQPTTAEGDIAIRRGAGSMFLGYWNRPEATAEKFRGDWLVTGDRGEMADGYLRFVGRDDDVITSGGYRIGPSEIEDVLIKHEAVAAAGVVGKPDPMRTEIVKAYVVLRDGFAPSDDLAAELQAHAKRWSAAHSYPREVAFLDELPMTVTGKVMRRELRKLAVAEASQTDPSQTAPSQAGQKKDGGQND
ncbi:AMP-binding protein [Paracoccus sp. SCSIO 75233]|uniref:AMP-binding protein n=1 Tax=Paracoccus sp. SCSIO 75233 TaxID=3017782 RepID=UPI0022F143F9|nr:AMP-binding protein [Paracoccus sp. SCSIO 75233]WBU53822.1 AMP-binding protein [Paracoccus sp. SCSIO 75233]